MTCLFRYTLIVLLSIGLASCTFKKQESTKLRIGMNAWPGYEYLYLAKELGYFSDEGIDVSLVEFSSLADTRRAFERGLVDIIGSTTVEMVFIKHQSVRPPVIVYVADESSGADVILAQKGFSDLNSLRGKKIGVELGSLTIYMLHLALRASGLNLGDVKLVPVDQSTMVSFFRDKQVDAVVTYPPMSMKVLSLGANTLFTSKQIPGKLLDVIVMDARQIKEQPGLAEKIERIFDRAVQFSLQNPSEAYAKMAKREGVSSDSFRQIVENEIKIFSKNDQKILRTEALIEQMREIEVVLFESKQVGPDKKIDGSEVFLQKSIP